MAKEIVRRVENLQGKRFGRWLVLSLADRSAAGATLWHCRCSCGTEKNVPAGDLKAGKTQSCGCQRREWDEAGHYQDLTGRRYGRLVVLGLFRRGTRKGPRRTKSLWRCRCDCGKEVCVLVSSLKGQRTRSCNCLRIEKTLERTLTHGMARAGQQAAEWKTWCSIKARCLNPRHSSYANYGGRGIRVCPEWIVSFASFYQAVGPRPSLRHSLDRIDNDGHYEPGNVRWVTAAVQNRNKRGVRLLSFAGEKLSIPDWADRLGLPTNVIRQRLAAGWSTRRTLTAPLRSCKTPSRKRDVLRATWRGMISRCHNSNDAAYRHYGGRGISVCARWRESFASFAQDMGKKPSPAHTLERIDNDDDYRPGNCRWATRAEQSRNRRLVRLITYRGEALPLSVWARRLGLCHAALAVRLARWPLERALTEPAHNTNHPTNGLFALGEDRPDLAR